MQLQYVEKFPLYWTILVGPVCVLLHTEQHENKENAIKNNAM